MKNLSSALCNLQSRVVVLALVAALVVQAALGARGEHSITYRLSFPEPEHHWMQVEVAFPNLPAEPLEVQFSRASPGRYALHEFAKNVYDVEFEGASDGIDVGRPSLHRWTVANHGGRVRMRYRIYGDRVDGTYLGIDTTHAHVNMPAALAWAHGLEDRPAIVTFDRPEGRAWEVATQLMPTEAPLVFRAPNLQYLMDSPTEFGLFEWHSFPAPGSGVGEPATIRIALHHAGSSRDGKRYADDVEKIVAEAREVFGEYPAFENQTYTFLADYLPSASGDGMEHRNSTVLTSGSNLASARLSLLGTVAHEFFHAWNVERIRPRSLEPFDFTAANVSPDLWLAEGFTSYYDGVLLHRAGLTTFDQFVSDLHGVIQTVVLSPAHRFRSAEDMSRLAPFVDAATWVDRTNWTNTFISYYTYGAALGLGFDLAIRQHTNGEATLDHFMRAMWQRHGKPGGSPPGTVSRPYDVDDVIAVLGRVTSDEAFARDLVERYVQGREVMDYQRLLANAGLILRSRNADRPSLGLVAFRGRPVGEGGAGGGSGTGGVTVTAPTRLGSAAYRAGIDQDDVIMAVAGQAVGTPQQLEQALARFKPGDRIEIAFERRGTKTTSEVVLDPDPRLELVTVESAGGRLTNAQRAFREAWTK